VPAGLEGELAAHLDGSCAAGGAANHAKIRRGGRPIVGSTVSGVRLSPDGQVEGVECVKGELRGIAVLKSDFLEDRHIGALVELGAQVVASRGAVCKWRGIGEGAVVEPVLRGLMRRLG